MIGNVNINALPLQSDFGDEIFFRSSDSIKQNENKYLLSKRDLDRFQNSIKANGFLDPITIRTDGTVADGRKRLCAAYCLDIPVVPCIFDSSSYISTDKRMINTIMQKTSGFFADAASIRTLIEKNLLTQDTVAEALGVSQSYVANKLRLLQFSENDRKIITDGGLTERHARCALKIKDATVRTSALKYISENKLTVSAAESYIDSLTVKEKLTDESGAGAIRHACRAIDKAVGTAENLGIPVTLRRFDDNEYVTYSIRLKR